MTKKRVVVLGASGFAGTALCERLQRDPGIELVPIIHRAGSAWRLARSGKPLVQADVSDADALRRALRGATHVVNCTRGSRKVMIDGLHTILASCRTEGVQRFIHLSSVAVYGDPPHPASHHESAPTEPRPGKDSYGAIKLEQDEMIRAATRRGLRSVVLCPPNISGPFSGYLTGIVDALRTGAFALVGDGQQACNIVDVRNLCHAIVLALEADESACDGERMFVTDGETITWARLISELQELAAVDDIPRIAPDALARRIQGYATQRKASVTAALRHLVSSDVRAALRKDPLLEKLDHAARAGIARMGRSIESRLRSGIEGPRSIAKPDPFPTLAVNLCSQQLRMVRHVSDRAKQVLGYRPVVSFNQSMQDFRSWYGTMHGIAGPFWDLSRMLRS